MWLASLKPEVDRKENIIRKIDADQWDNHQMEQYWGYVRGVHASSDQTLQEVIETFSDVQDSFSQAILRVAQEEYAKRQMGYWKRILADENRVVCIPPYSDPIATISTVLDRFNVKTCGVYYTNLLESEINLLFMERGIPLFDYWSLQI